MTRARRLALPFALVAVAAVAIVVAARQPPPSPADAFTVRDEMIPMRDGVKLYTRIFTPKRPAGAAALRLPPHALRHRRRRRIVRPLLQGAGRRGLHLRLPGHPREVQVRGHVRDACGRPATRRHDQAIDEGTDTYDTIEWLLKNVPEHNGRVGMLGVSYDGWTTVMARCSSRTRRSRPSRRRPRPPTCGSATTSTTTARSA